jgi:hypothetical protein
MTGRATGRLNQQDLIRMQDLAAECRRKEIASDSRLKFFEHLRTVEPFWKTVTSWQRQEPEPRWSSRGNPDTYQKTELEPEGESNPNSLSTGAKEQIWEVVVGRLNASKVVRMESSAEVDAEAFEVAAVSPCLTALSDRMDGHRFFTTTAGFFGVGIANVDLRDVICLFEGMLFPIVLRPWLDGYRLAGVAYVSGLMEWDKLDQCLAKGSLQEKIFTIY